MYVYKVQHTTCTIQQTTRVVSKDLKTVKNKKTYNTRELKGDTILKLLSEKSPTHLRNFVCIIRYMNSFEKKFFQFFLH